MPARRACGRALRPTSALQVGVAARRARASTCREPRHAGDRDQALERHATSTLLQVVQRRRRATVERGVARVDRAARLQRMRAAACARKRPVTRLGMSPSARRRVPCATTRPPRVPAPGPRSMTWSARRIVSSSCSTTTSVLPLSPSLCERVEQDAGCRADAGRWSARRARSRRPAGSSRAAPRGGCAAPRRPRASARRGRARDSRGRPPRGTRAARLISATRSRAISASRPGERERLEELARARRPASALRSAIDSLAEAHRAARPGSGACRRSRGRARRRSSHSTPRVEHVVLGAGRRRALVVLASPLASSLQAGADAGRRTSRACSCRRTGAGRARGSSCRRTGRRACVENTLLRERGPQSPRAIDCVQRRAAARARAPRPCRARAPWRAASRSSASRSRRDDEVADRQLDACAP